MNREIKFRGKKIDNNEWVYGNLVIDTDKTCYSIIDYANERTNTYSWHNVVPSTVGQFIGSLDKNGNEIYEGDILQWFLNDNKTPSGIEVVKWKEVDNGHDGCYTGFSLISTYIKTMKIVGNIYDNPELLK